MYSRYAIGSGNAFSLIAIVTKPLGNPVLLTTPRQDCGQPAPSPDGTMVAMICVGGTGLQSTRLEVAPLVGTKLGAPRTLVNNCLCSAPEWAPDGSGLVYYNTADASGHFEPVLDQRGAVGNAVGAAPGDHQPGLRRVVATLLVAPCDSAGDVPLIR